MKSNIRVAVDVRDLRIARTGAKTYLEELVRQFRKVADPEIEFRLYDTSIPVYTGRNKILKIVEHIRFTIWKQVQLPLKVWLGGCDVLFTTDYFLPYFHPRFRTYTVFHDAFFFEYPDHYNKLWLYLFRTLAVPAAKRSEGVITPTNYTRERLAVLSGIPPGKLKVIYEGPKTLEAGNEKTDIDLPDRYLLHVGTMEKRKNIPNLLKAFSHILDKDPSLMLVLVGQFSPKAPIDARSDIMNTIDELDLGASVVLKGYVSDQHLSTLYMNAQAYIFPSTNEGFGIPILEAFKNGLPVLVADNTCLPEVGGEAVLKFNPYDPSEMAEKICMVLEDQDLRAQMIIAGKERLKLFSWENASKELIQIFKQQHIPE